MAKRHSLRETAHFLSLLWWVSNRSSFGPLTCEIGYDEAAVINIVEHTG
jgi:hypothetical protein